VLLMGQNGSGKSSLFRVRWLSMASQQEGPANENYSAELKARKSASITAPMTSSACELSVFA
jgi:ABC-type Mn2+/Zn2+ transport system ATPase subunit